MQFKTNNTKAKILNKVKKINKLQRISWFCIQIIWDIITSLSFDNNLYFTLDTILIYKVFKSQKTADSW